MVYVFRNIFFVNSALENILSSQGILFVVVVIVKFFVDHCLFGSYEFTLFLIIEDKDAKYSNAIRERHLKYYVHTKVYLICILKNFRFKENDYHYN